MASSGRRASPGARWSRGRSRGHSARGRSAFSSSACARRIPGPRTELAYRSPYQLLVSVILSAQATDKSVNLATRPLFEIAGTPQAMVALGEQGLAAISARSAYGA